MLSLVFSSYDLCRFLLILELNSSQTYQTFSTSSQTYPLSLNLFHSYSVFSFLLRLLIHLSSSLSFISFSFFFFRFFYLSFLLSSLFPCVDNRSQACSTYYILKTSYHFYFRGGGWRNHSTNTITESSSEKFNNFCFKFV